MEDALDSRRRIFPAPLFRTAVMPGDRLPDVGMERFADGTGFGRALQDFLVFRSEEHTSELQSQR